MAVNEVIYDGETLISLTNDTVTEDDLVEGVTAHDASGNSVTGTARYVKTVNNITPDAVGNVTYPQANWTQTNTTKSDYIKNKPDVATKAYVQEQIAEFDFIKVVDVLPDVGLINRFYLVPKANEEQTTTDLFDEYIWVEDTTKEEGGYWEWITTKQIEIDLTPYATKEALEETNNEINSINNYLGDFYTQMLSFTGDSITIENLGINPQIKVSWGPSDTSAELLIQGKNLCNFGETYSPNSTGTLSGVTWTAQSDGSILFQGTSNSSGSLRSNTFTLAAGTYTISGNTLTATNGGANTYLRNTNNQVIVLQMSNTNVTFTLEETTEVIYEYYWFENTVFDNYVLKPQIEYGTAASYYVDWKNFRTETVTKGQIITGYTPTTTISNIPKVLSSGGLIEYITSFKYSILDTLYPVGSIYLSLGTLNPNTLFGYGTWQLISSNKMLMGTSASSEAGQTGGSDTHTHETAFRFASWYNEVVLENHEETGIMAYEPNGSKTATGNTRVDYTDADSENNYYNASTETKKVASGQMGLYETVGNTSYETALPPYIKVNMWQRIA